MIIGLILGSFDDVWMEDELLWFLEEDEGEREGKNLWWFLEEDEDESKEEKKCILLYLQIEVYFCLLMIFVCYVIDVSRMWQKIH